MPTRQPAAATAPPTPWRRRIAWGLALLLIGVVAACLAAWWLLRGSLPALDGERAVPGLAAPVQIERDALGVPAIRGQSRDDVAYATGFAHAQDRFFQMDLLRRAGAGELAELVGPAALPVDEARRLHRFRARLEAAWPTLPAADRALIERYTDGVNAGLAALAVRPFEYLLLQEPPAPWRPVDTLLVVAAMAFDLQGGQLAGELARDWLAAHSTPAQLALLWPEATVFDAPLDVPAFAAAQTAASAPWPASGPAWLGAAASAPAPSALAWLAPTEPGSVGSNAWAVAAPAGPRGHAALANDMHLGLRLPAIWYRARLQWPGGDIVGATLPGAPLVVVGSNGHIAWGFTNSYLRTLRLVPAGPVLALHDEVIRVRGTLSVTLAVQETAQGPVRPASGQAVAWTMHAPGAIGLQLAQMEGAADVATALDAAALGGIPMQNVLVVDTAGRAAYTLAGGAPGPRPRLEPGPGARLWTANSRVLASADYAALGDGGFDLGARASQLQGALRALPDGADEAALFAVGLDDRALYLAPWRERALRVLDGAALQGQPARADFRRLLEAGWTGHADVGSVGYRLTRAFYDACYAELFGAADAALSALHPEASVQAATRRWPVLAARVLDEDPPGWLPPERRARAVALAAVDRAIAAVQAGGPLADARWGAYNAVAIAHPLAGSLPLLARWLAAPTVPQAGDRHMPLVAAPRFGASERLVVVPGQEDRGLYAQPGGASGHPLSPYFLAGHSAWVAGQPLPLRPGAPQHRLTLAPR